MPYLLHEMQVSRCNQVWETDITYIWLPSGFVYFSALIDVYSRFILAWRIYSDQEADLCLDILNEAVQSYGIPEIINTDQGSQYTGNEWKKAVEALGNTKISHDGKGRWADNIFIERFWNSAKGEHVKLRRTETLKELRTQMAEYIEFYNYRRLHQSLRYKTPAAVYCGGETAPIVNIK
jgi:putative transposase